ncbi:unnamed protein product [Peronospora effusa]|uniref:Uncharacterized protein n=1 Tax=Peronospora effusa TaxID=542832 RepID=A0A3M6VJF6_9STRA|nr:hypothetical protein DD238_003066 [Peronospora effusa]RQM13341.1 hypothetical protein DD237_003831 [Peronospora effusa]CAI5702858.1 unnamed protein product [Peronospora effusa]
MLMANRPSILRRYHYTQIPPIRRPVVSIERGTRRAQNMLDEDWRETSKPTEQPTYHYSQYQAPQPARSSSSRTGYSWQRLQETIQRESRAHGITNDKDESAYEDTDTCKAEESETPTDGVEVTGSKSSRTRNCLA